MSSFKHSIPVTKVQAVFSDPAYAKKAPVWATVHGDNGTMSGLRAAHQSATIDGYVGVVAPLSSHNLKIDYTTEAGEPVTVSSEKLKVVVGKDMMVIEIIDLTNSMSASNHSQRMCGCIQIECALGGFMQ